MIITEFLKHLYNLNYDKKHEESVEKLLLSLKFELH